ncbi:hypothetical protein GCM10011367_15930 [Marinicauda pacifica]|uniref:DUF2813 domain-containing protein n=1 Tax=Marinicauda pacifica TaxID=1133559 RepID=A0A4S2HAQ2_9PROT|nr:ATP-binding protein [Marinicauda pacifica]TGY93005.1 DUF2813 domain-containing protein [Marinicauda pacifica]GGE42072.1 hypothetical protein GCM10011367_15930 [Marinicauda pacifica]
MLRRIEISRFKSIHHADIELGEVNIFIGPNGSGKSNILEAVGILASALGRGLAPQDLDYKGVRLSTPRLFKSSFRNQNIPKTFQLIGHFDRFTYKCTLSAGGASRNLSFHSESLYVDGGLVIGRSPHGTRLHKHKKGFDWEEFREEIPPHRGAWDVLGPFADIPDEVEAEINAFSRYVIYSPQTAVMRGLATDSRVIEPLGLTGSRLATAFKETLSEKQRVQGLESKKRFEDILQIIWAPGWADRINIGRRNDDIVPPQVKTEGEVIYIRDKYMKTSFNMLSPYDASEGTLYLIFVATLLSHPEAPTSFGLDNVDGTLNPGLVRRLVDHIVKVSSEGAEDSKPNKQVFLTSHNPTALDAFDIFDSNHAVFVTTRRMQVKGVRLDSHEIIGETKFRRLIPPEGMTPQKWNERARGKNLSELYISNEIQDALG